MKEVDKQVEKDGPLIEIAMEREREGDTDQWAKKEEEEWIVKKIEKKKHLSILLRTFLHQGNFLQGMFL